ncbi:MAG: DUF6799 domain-containing protein [Bacteroidia bacterium]
MDRKTTALIVTGIVLVGVGGFFSLNSLSGEPEMDEHGGDYCAKPKDGKIEVFHNGKALNSEVTLNNGTQIKTDGTVVMKDGSELTLKENQCLNKNGSISPDQMGNDILPKDQGEIPEDQMSKDGIPNK